MLLIVWCCLGLAPGVRDVVSPAIQLRLLVIGTLGNGFDIGHGPGLSQLNT
jgi:hypothetical protein